MIHVVGGTYLEHCREPHYFELFGSGLRASLTLQAQKSRVRFSTFVDSRQNQVLQAKAGNISLNVIDARKTVQFSYLHPLSRPTIEPDSYVRSCSYQPREIEVQADKILRFGMIEGSARVCGKMVTYDPQTPDNPRPFSENGSVAERLAVVANRTEALRLTGKQKPIEACKIILKKGAEVAVVKCGTAGCIVGTSSGIRTVPAFRTNRVWPIGSGDVFSALFAHGWMELGLKPFEAAYRASQGTSYYVEQQQFPSREQIQKNKFKPLHVLPPKRRKQVYLAGPFFNLSQRWLIEEFKNALFDCGVRVFSPLHDVGRGAANDIYAADIEGLKKSGVILACLDGLDSGTIYEVGYAHCLNKKVIAFVSGEQPEDLKMIVGGGSQMTNDFATALYLTVWSAICR